MAENSTYSTPTPYIKKRKHQDRPPDSLSPNSCHRQSGISSPIIDSPVNEIQQPKKRAQEIAARLDDGDYWNDEPNDYVENQPQEICVRLVPASEVESKKIEIPNGKVGVIFGKEGDKIKYFEDMSGAKIKSDVETDPSAPTQEVELMGSPDEIKIAEQLINEALAKVPQQFTGQLPGAVHSQMEVPKNKVRFIIGKNRETIKYLQASSGARIQVPLHTELGDTSAEKTVHIYGTPTQIKRAEQLISEVIRKNRNPFMVERFPLQGPPPPPNWCPPGAPPLNQIGFGSPSQAHQGSNTSQSSYPSYPPQPTSGGHCYDHTSTYGQQHGASYGGSGYAQPPAAQQITPQPGYCSRIGALSGNGGSQAAYFQGQYSLSTGGGGICNYEAQGPTDVPPSTSQMASVHPPTLALICTQKMNRRASYSPHSSVQTSYGSQPGPSRVAQAGCGPSRGNTEAYDQVPPRSST